MKQTVSPQVAILVIAIMVAIIGMAYWKLASPGARAAEIEKSIQASVAGGPGPGKAMMPPSAPKAPSATPAQKTKP